MIKNIGAAMFEPKSETYMLAPKGVQNMFACRIQCLFGVDIFCPSLECTIYENFGAKAFEGSCCCIYKAFVGSRITAFVGFFVPLIFLAFEALGGFFPIKPLKAIGV